MSSHFSDLAEPHYTMVTIRTAYLNADISLIVFNTVIMASKI
jgi:hypothetical protein